MSDRKTFEARYQVEDGYAGGTRPQYFTIDAGDLEDDMTDDELESLYHEKCEEDMRQKIGCGPNRIDEFVAWAREQLNERAKGEA